MKVDMTHNEDGSADLKIDLDLERPDEKRIYDSLEILRGIDCAIADALVVTLCSGRPASDESMALAGQLLKATGTSVHAELMIQIHEDIRKILDNTDLSKAVLAERDNLPLK